MDFGMNGKNILVTGSTSGIGKGIAKMFAGEGANVVINSIFQNEIDETVAQLQAEFPNVKITGIKADLGNLEEANYLYDTVTKDAPLDILVNSLGIYPVVPFEKITDEEWYHIFNINVMSTVRLARRALPDMLKRNSGKIINIASEAAMRPNGDLIHYSATKACLVNLSRGMAELTKGTKVTVNSVLPVTTWTEGIEKYIASLAERDGCTPEEAKINYFRTGNDNPSLLQRFLTLDEVAKAVLFAAGNDGVNGNSILIDAGVIHHI